MAKLKAPTFSQVQQARKRIADYVHRTPVISSELLKLGLILSLNFEEEERINDVMGAYTKKIHERFNEQESFNVKLKSTVEFMREPNQEFKEYINSINSSDESDDLAELF